MSSELPPPPAASLGELLDSWSEPSDVARVAPELAAVPDAPVEEIPTPAEAPDLPLSAAPIPSLPSLPSLPALSAREPETPIELPAPAEATHRSDAPLMPALPVLTLGDTPAPTSEPQADVAPAPASLQNDAAPLPTLALQPEPTSAGVSAPTVVATPTLDAAPVIAAPTPDVPPTPVIDPAVPTAPPASETAPVPTLAPARPATESEPPPNLAPTTAVAPAPAADSAGVVPVLPTTPAITVPAAAASAPKVGAAMSPAQLAAIEAAKSGQASTAKPRQIPQRSMPARIVRTGFIAILVAGLGVGGRFGYDYYENGRDPESAETTASTVGAGFLPPIGSAPPTEIAQPISGNYVDVTTVVESAEQSGVNTTRLRYSLRSSNLVVDYSGAGEDYSLDVRDDRFLLRPQGQETWFDASDMPEITALPAGFGDLIGYVPMFHDLVPVEAVPFVTVVAEANVQLNVVPLDPPVMPQQDTDTGVSVSGEVDPSAQEVVDTFAEQTADAPAPRPSGPIAVRHYTLSIDEAAFASAAPLAHANWASDGRAGEPNLDIWVDDLGVVRQLVQIVDGKTVTITFNDIADQLADFQNEVLVATPIVDEGN